MDDRNSLRHDPYLMASLAVIAFEVLAAFLGNGFIVVVNIHDWLKNCVKPVDHLLVVLALSNFGFSFVYGNYVFFVFTWPRFFLVDYAYPVTFSFIFLLSLSSSWLISWLSLFYCLKIVPFKSLFLARLKMSIDSAVVWLILILEVISVTCSIPMIWSFHRSLPQNITTAQNVSQIGLFKLDNIYMFPLGLSSCCSSLIVLVSLVCIIVSLCRHTHRMRKHISPEDDSLLRTHQSAAKTVVSLLLIFILFFTLRIVTPRASPSDDFNILYWLNAWMLMAIPPALSVVLILGNFKLWLALKKIMRVVHCNIHV